ncbi:MAG: FecR domain-containing protein [Phormidesmis sp.]
MSVLYPVKSYLLSVKNSILHLKRAARYRLTTFLSMMVMGCVVVAALSVFALPTHPLTVEGDRWLAITNVRGRVDFTPYQGSTRRAQVGDRLASVGDILMTGPNASVRLIVDQQAGAVSMAENSELRVRTLSTTSRGGRITVIDVLRGQIRMTVRSLTNPDSRLEIYTPAGISGVRGTDFGVTVQPTGRTGVATSEGSVYAIAQGETVSVAADRQTTMFPGEPPEPPEPLRDDPTLFVEALSALPCSVPSNPMARVVGFTDEVNLIQINNDSKALSREGRFDVVVPMSADRRVQISVLTPLGTEQQYVLVVP